MATEIVNNVPSTDKEKELKDDAPADNGQTKEKEDVPASVEKTETKSEEKKPETVKPTVHHANFEKDVVYLYQFPRNPMLPSTSPYCLKVETWLRLVGIMYENVDHKAKFRSKKGQLPFVELNGEEIADSTIIIQQLSEKFNKDLDAGLTKEQRVVSHAMISMIENHLSWVILWWRAKYPESVLKGYKINLQNALNTRLPNPILNFCYKITSGRKGLKKAKAHGIGVHGQEHIIEFGKKDLKALSDLLADKPFFFGDEPTLLDVVAFAHLSQLVYLEAGVSHELRDALEALPNLGGLVARVRARAFLDWDDMCTALDLNSHLPKPPPAAATQQTPAPEIKAEEKEKEKEAEKEPEEKQDSEKEKEK